MLSAPEDTAEKPKPQQHSSSKRTQAREAFFLEFAHAIRSHFPDVPLLVTGGFRTRQGMEAAVTAGGGADVVGIARPAAMNPTLPKSIIFNAEVKDEDAKLYLARVPVPWIFKQISPGVGAGVQSVSLSLFCRMRMSVVLDEMLTGHHCRRGMEKRYRRCGSCERGCMHKEGLWPS